MAQIEALGNRVYCWNANDTKGPWDNLVDATALDAALETSHANTLILIDPAQLFLKACLRPARSTGNNAPPTSPFAKSTSSINGMGTSIGAIACNT